MPKPQLSLILSTVHGFLKYETNENIFKNHFIFSIFILINGGFIFIFKADTAAFPTQTLAPSIFNVLMWFHLIMNGFWVLTSVFGMRCKSK